MVPERILDTRSGTQVGYCGSARPTASNLNVLANETKPNLVTVKVGSNGTVCLFTQSGTHLIADIAGDGR